MIALTERRCPLVVGVIVCVAAIAGTALLAERLLLAVPSPHLGASAIGVAVCVVLDRRGRTSECPWFEHRLGYRVVAFAALVVAASSTLIPMIRTDSSAARIVFAIPLVLFLVSFSAWSAIHLRVDHQEAEEAVIPRRLHTLSGLVVYFFWALLFLFFVAVAIVILVDLVLRSAA